MASVEKKTRTTVERTYTLVLTEAEAEAVAAVLGNVSGEIGSTPRKESDGVFFALQRAGVDVARATGDHAGRKVSGTLKFHKTAAEAERAKAGSGVFAATDLFKSLGY